jgi:hypothetical protein
MWTAIYVAIGIENALEVEKKLKNEGFLIKKRLFSLEGEDELYEIIAPEFEAEEIQEAMLELGII